MLLKGEARWSIYLESYVLDVIYLSKVFREVPADPDIISNLADNYQSILSGL